ncbi:hypothetical protein [Streptomyces sp. NPDC048419]|uniref:hypothetical protein n=1 Tax=Streptomyces sp. NPDC048419 TaxID=3365547 RepID=UPI00370F8FA1
MNRRDDDGEIYALLELRAVARMQAEHEVALRAVRSEERLWDSLGYALASLISLAIAILLGIMGAALMCSLAVLVALSGGFLFALTRRQPTTPRIPPSFTPR